MATKLTPARLAQRVAFQSLVADVAARLETGSPTVFAFEGSTRHQLRSAWVLEGMKWSKADEKAEAVIMLAFRKLKAIRPTWLEGQSEFARGGGRLFCANTRCAQIITRHSDQATLYCSEVCRLRAKSFRGYWEEQAARIEYARKARRTIRTQAKPRICEWSDCGREFQPLDYTGKKPQRFCSQKCRSRYASSCSGWRKDGAGPRSKGCVKTYWSSLPT